MFLETDIKKAEYLKIFKNCELLNNSVCWWCTFEIPEENLPVSAPTYFNEIRNEFKVHGIFCCFECAKSYLIDRNDSYVDTSLITLLNKRLTGSISRINCAPPRIALKKFGGTMTINEFRENSRSGLQFVSFLTNIKHETMCVKERNYQHKQLDNVSKFSNIPDKQPIQSSPHLINEDLNISKKNRSKHKNNKSTSKSDPSLEKWMGLTIV